MSKIAVTFAPLPSADSTTAMSARPTWELPTETRWIEPTEPLPVCRSTSMPALL
jgi:hypothetical protein